MAIATLPVQHGAKAAAVIASILMALPQLAVVMLLVHWGLGYHALAVAALLAIQRRS